MQIWIIIVIENSIKLQKMFWKENISWVISSHLD